MTGNRLASLPQDVNTVIVSYLLDLLAGALQHRDGKAAVNILHQLRVVAGPAWTDKLIDDLIAAGLRRLAQRIQEARTDDHHS